MEHNFDLPSIQAYQAKIVGELNSQIGKLQAEQSSLNDQKDSLNQQKEQLSTQLSAVSSSSADTPGAAAAKAAAIAALTVAINAISNQITAIESRLSTIGSQITTLSDAIQETNDFVTGLDTRINATDMSYAEKLRQINEAIQTYTNNMKNLTDILYPSVTTGTFLDSKLEFIRGVKVESFKNILANMTETSYGYTMVGCINGNIDGRIPNADIAKATKEALGIAGLKDASKLLAWAQTLGMASSADIASLISDGTLSYMGIDPDQVRFYTADAYNSFMGSLNGESLTNYQKNLANCINGIMQLPHQNPIPGFSMSTGIGDYDGHVGLDYSTSGTIGHTIQSTVPGIVEKVSTTSGGYGKHVFIRDINGNLHIYGHMSDNNYVSVGDYVLPGQQIGESGNTGNVSGNIGPYEGAHLHYEVQSKGSNADNKVSYTPATETSSEIPGYLNPKDFY